MRPRQEYCQTLTCNEFKQLTKRNNPRKSEHKIWKYHIRSNVANISKAWVSKAGRDADADYRT